MSSDTRLRSRLLRGRVLWPALLLCCCSTRPCKPNTVVADIEYQGIALQADTVEIQVQHPHGASLVSQAFQHSPGATRSSVEIDFPNGYPRGEVLNVRVLAFLGTDPGSVGSAEEDVLLKDTCERISLKVAPPSGDGGAPDLLLPDLAPPEDLAVPDLSWPPRIFLPPVSFPISSAWSGQSVAIGDVTGDGRADVILGVAATNFNLPGGILVFPQTGAGSLGAPTSYPIGGRTGTIPYSLAVGDLNSDGRSDVVVVRNFDRDVALLLQNASGRLDSPQTLQGTPGVSAEHSVAIGDLDNDGRADVVAVKAVASGVEVWFQSAQGTFGSPSPYPCPYNTGSLVAVADLDADGRNEVIVAGDSTTACVLSQQPGGLASHFNVTTPRSVSGFAIGDVSSDAHPDIVYATKEDPNYSLGVVEQVDAGIFSPGTFLASSAPPGNVAIVDVDGDGLLDIVVLHSGSPAFGVYRQVQGGGLESEDLFAANTSPSINLGPNVMAVGDINGDGLPDVVMVGSEVVVFYHR